LVQFLQNSGWDVGQAARVSRKQEQPRSTYSSEALQDPSATSSSLPVAPRMPLPLKGKSILGGATVVRIDKVVNRYQGEGGAR
jgi:hypothetical protein